ncbi:DeoR/GlpR family DNA-binding transcription regulator [Cohnella sp.]|uniref:DeoR/GlpR family DNA-binding transcription regulator n=1 Tax=Cohnella sp. TaxID=1883426 RepID=UPI0035612F67
MYEVERKSKILEIIKENQRVDVQALNKILQVSESTIRRDLKELEGSNLLKRTHGGAVALHNVGFEPTFSEKEISNSELKKAIAEKAIELIVEGDVILLDSGTTMLYLAKELKRFRKLTVVTNAITIAQELQAYEGIDVIMLGGSLRKGILSLVGPFAEQILSLIHVDKAFIATNGIDVEAGLSTPNVDEANIKRKMIASAKKTILLADSSKIGIINLVKFAILSDIDLFITDNGIEDSCVSEFIMNGIELHIAEGNGERKTG